MSLSVIEKNGKFVVAIDNKPITLPKSDGQTVTTEFDRREDAERYLGILATLKKQKKYA